MRSSQRHPENVAVWTIDDETGEVDGSDHYTNWNE